jgi:hypothetical protein
MKDPQKMTLDELYALSWEVKVAIAKFGPQKRTAAPAPEWLLRRMGKIS